MNSKNDIKANIGDKPEFVYEISTILTHLKLLSNKFDLYLFFQSYFIEIITFLFD